MCTKFYFWKLQGTIWNLIYWLLYKFLLNDSEKTINIKKTTYLLFFQSLNTHKLSDMIIWAVFFLDYYWWAFTTREGIN